jgi:membrane-associated protease RseP (regulator of RpoE activity)
VSVIFGGISPLLILSTYSAATFRGPKFKGTPVREVIEQRFHQVGFFLLLLLMVVVTVRDFSQFRILEKIGNLFS